MGKNRRMTEQDQTPWFSKWKQNFMAMNRFQLHELTQQPVGLIYMISVDDDDPVETIKKLRR